MINQLKILLTKEEKTPSSAKSCAFTGHRHLDEDFSARKLKKEVKKLIEQGVSTFYNGMAMGFDLIAAETVLSLKKNYPFIQLIACVPCYGQEKYFSETDKKRYVKILKAATETVILAEHYYNGCMQNRDRYMVDKADILLAYCKKEEGGTAYTVNYFKKTKNIDNILFF